MKKICSPNFTQIPNSLLDSIHELEDSELRILLVICRETFGWHRDRTRLSLTDFEEKTGLAHQTVCVAIKSLVEQGLICKSPAEPGFFYSLVVFEEEGSLMVRLPANFAQSNDHTPSSLTIRLPERPSNIRKESTKESTSCTLNFKSEKKERIRQSRETILKEVQTMPVPEKVLRPDFVDEWKRWVAYRVGQKTVKNFVEMFRGQLELMAEWGPDHAIASMKRSRCNGYQGIFELPNFANKGVTNGISHNLKANLDILYDEKQANLNRVNRTEADRLQFRKIKEKIQALEQQQLDAVLAS